MKELKRSSIVLKGCKYNLKKFLAIADPKLECVLFYISVFNDLEAMIATLTRKEPSVKGLLLDRHVAVSNMEQFRTKSLEIGRTIDCDYFIGLSVRPPPNSTHICEMIKSCASKLVHSEEFELAALKVVSKV